MTQSIATLSAPEIPLPRLPHSCECSPMTSVSEIQDLAMKLPVRSRLKLAGELLRSVAPSQSADEVLEEAKRRDQEIASGLVKSLSETEFWNGVRNRRLNA